MVKVKTLVFPALRVLSATKNSVLHNSGSGSATRLVLWVHFGWEGNIPRIPRA